jgi:hypothetical protein
VAINELTQLHIMNAWMAMDPSKLSREDQVKVLSSLLFLKKSKPEKSKVKTVSMEHHGEPTH